MMICQTWVICSRQEDADSFQNIIRSCFIDFKLSYRFSLMAPKILPFSQLIIYEFTGNQSWCSFEACQGTWRQASETPLQKAQENSHRRRQEQPWLSIRRPEFVFSDGFAFESCSKLKSRACEHTDLHTYIFFPIQSWHILTSCLSCPLVHFEKTFLHFFTASFRIRIRS